ncbi:MAG: hypothetical protein HY975_00725 [Candidatus Kerfeldbacteria bacterium]|nr:hypothetical protein [Candidatus Kerfeldbacteria bacterium]
MTHRALTIGHIVTALLSILAAFFGVFNVLFSDILTSNARFGALAYVFILYFIISFIVHGVWRTRSRAWLWWLFTPAVLFGGWIAVSEGSGPMWYPWAVLACVIAASVIGRRVFTPHLPPAKR